jgi:hypothetical protein
MPAKISELHRMLANKLQAEWNEGGGHTKYRIIEGDTLIANTVLSRSVTEIDDSLLAKICRQLSVRRQELDHLLRCTWTREQYIRHVID